MTPSSRGLLTLILCAGPLFGASSTSPQPAAPTSNYTNDWDKSGPSNTVVSPSYIPPGSFNFPYSSRGSYSGSNFSVQSYYYNRQTIYFPPEPVALGQPLNVSTAFSRMSGARTSVMSLMAPYLAEFFYAPLSSQMHDEEISNKQLQRISDYRQQRQQVLSQLRAKIDELRNVEPAKRKAELAALAATMDPQILALEGKAEELRRSMVDGGLFAPSVDWNDTRSWRLGDDAKFESYQDEYLVMRASAYFQVGLSTSQRLLLREVASDLRRRGVDPTNDISLDSQGSYFNFSPFTARIRLPKQLPEELRSKINLYREKKHAIKQDLRDTIYKTDRAWLNSTRAKAIAEFNKRQDSEIAALDVLAEEIREGLASCHFPDEPQQTPLTKALGERLTKYLQEKTDFQRSIMSKLTELKSQLPYDRIELDRTDLGMRVVIESRRGGNAALNERREAAKRELQSFNASLAANFQRLDEMREQLRVDVESFAGQVVGKRERTMDQLIAECSRAFLIQENWNRYSEYRTAVVEPGLSPAQRRLLYAGSLENLMTDFLR